MKTLKVGIASAEDMIARTMSIARGELKPTAADPKVWFTSPESFAQSPLEQKPRALESDRNDSSGVASRSCSKDWAQGVQPLTYPQDDGTLRLCQTASRRAWKDQAGGSLSGNFADLGVVRLPAPGHKALPRRP
jgi:hypothetical protein